MAWLKVWRLLLQLPGMEGVFCRCGFIHKKEFRPAGVNLNLEKLARPCRGGHDHVVAQGRYTEASAVYPGELAREIAVVYGEYTKDDRSQEADGVPSGSGLESPGCPP